MVELVFLVAAVAITAILVVVRREPMRFLLMWTALYGAGVCLLAPAIAAPAAPSCRDMCDLEQRLAAAGVLLITVVWLVIAVLVRWLWNRGRTHEGH